MALTDHEKSEIISYANDHIEGESICDDEGSDVVFTYSPEGEQPSIGTETVLELLKRGYFVNYGLINEDRQFELSITNGEGFRNE